MLTAQLLRASVDDKFAYQFLKETDLGALRLLELTGSRYHVADDFDRLAASYDTRLAIVALLAKARPTARPGLRQTVRLWWLSRKGG